MLCQKVYQDKGVSEAMFVKKYLKYLTLIVKSSVRLLLTFMSVVSAFTVQSNY